MDEEVVGIGVAVAVAVAVITDLIGIGVDCAVGVVAVPSETLQPSPSLSGASGVTTSLSPQAITMERSCLRLSHPLMPSLQNLVGQGSDHVPAPNPKVSVPVL
ncbi:MAG: hypothetical protein ACI8RZ_005024 [Myxococcota bacterium]|jgi:hypothetical protein